MEEKDRGLFEGRISEFSWRFIEDNEIFRLGINFTTELQFV
jgi:hypothetical protein